MHVRLKASVAAAIDGRGYLGQSHCWKESGKL
jgi:hypothetical protein